MSKPTLIIANRFHPHVLLKAQQEDFFEVIHCQKIEEARASWEAAEALIVRSSTQITEQLLKHFPKLKVIVTATSGFDHIDLQATKKIKVYHVPDAHIDSVVELTFMFIFAALRFYPKALQQMQQGLWERRSLMGSLMSGKSLGIIGLGRIGSKVAQRAQTWGLKVRAFDPYLHEPPADIEMLGFEELMRSSDIISLHVPLTKKTRAMIKAETLSWLGEESLLLNTSRGEVINENDLVLHLKEQPRFLAALDVFEREPLKKDSPLLSLPNVVTTPHIGATTEEALLASSTQALEKVRDSLSGKDVADSLPPEKLWWADNA